MRAVKAKRFRAIVSRSERLVEQTTYQNKEHKARLVPTGRFKESGMPEMVKVVPVTATLGDNCRRHKYQQLKKLCSIS